MKTSKLTLISAAVATAGIVAAIYEYNAAQVAGRESAEARKSSDQLRQQFAQTIAAREKSPSKPPMVGNEQRQAPVNAGDHTSPLAGFLKMLGAPRIQRMTSLQAKIRLDAQYGALFRALNLRGRAGPLGPPRPTGGPSGPALPQTAPVAGVSAPASEAPKITVPGITDSSK